MNDLIKHLWFNHAFEKNYFLIFNLFFSIFESF